MTSDDAPTSTQPRQVLEDRPPTSPAPGPARLSTRRALVGTGVLGLLAAVAACAEEKEEPLSYKPVLYVYPPEPTALTVRLDLAGTLLTCYPAGEAATPAAPAGDAVEWDVTAQPDGTLADVAGRTYPSLFWDGANAAPMRQDEGTVVTAEGAVAYLEEVCAAAGLTDREAAELITFWAPVLRGRGTSLVTLAGDQQAAVARYTLTGADGTVLEPECVIRLYLVIGDVPEEPVPPQALPAAPRREGLTLVEWGGTLQ